MKRSRRPSPQAMLVACNAYKLVAEVECPAPCFTMRRLYRERLDEAAATLRDDPDAWEAALLDQSPIGQLVWAGCHLAETGVEQLSQIVARLTVEQRREVKAVDPRG